MSKPFERSRTIQKKPGIRQTSNPLQGSDIGEFLTNGAILSRRSGQLVIGWGPWTRAERLPNASYGFFAPDFYLNDPQPWWIPAHLDEIETAVLKNLLHEFLKRCPPRSNAAGESIVATWNEPARDRFAEIFSRLRKAFALQEAEKTVPVIFAERILSCFGPEWLAERILMALEPGEPLFVYGFWGAAEGLLGLTPETLFRVSDNGDVETMALAGTRRQRLDASGEVEFLADPKERREHQLVVDDIRAALQPFGHVETGSTGVLRLPTLTHLHTPIRLKPNEDLGFERLVTALHPTPALGVAPRDLGLEWMRQWDDVAARGRFGAPFGLAGPGVSECLVAIRNIQWQDSANGRRLKLGSGCGLVAESVFESEWRELAAKRESVRRLLGV